MRLFVLLVITAGLAYVKIVGVDINGYKVGGEPLTLPPQTERVKQEDYLSMNGPNSEFWSIPPLDQVMLDNEDGKNIMLLFKSKRCSNCRHMGNTVYNEDDVKERVSRSFVPVLVDSSTESGEQLYYNYEVHSTPTHLFLSGNGKELARIRGRKTKEEFFQILAKY